MSKKTKIWIIIASSLVLVGCMIFTGVMINMKWDFTKLSTIEYETNVHKINDDYKNISILTDTADISFVPSEDGESRVECFEQKKTKHTVAVIDGTLVIEISDTRKWYEYIGINFDTPKITVSIPQGERGVLSVKSSTGDVEIPKSFEFESIDVAVSTGKVMSGASALKEIKIKTTTGDIGVETVSANTLDLSVSTGGIAVSRATCTGDVKVNISTGKADLSDIECKNIVSSGSTGDISLKNVIAEEKLSIKRSTGDVKFDSSDAAEVVVETDTGDVKGSLLSDKVFIVQTDTGSIDVPKTVSGGRCAISTDTGDIKIVINNLVIENI